MKVIQYGTHQSGVNYFPDIDRASGKMILVSGPSGVGKGSIINGLFDDPSMKDLISRTQSVTTRAPRPGEKDSRWVNLINRLKQVLLRKETGPEKQYDFISTKAFETLHSQQKLFQWGHYDKNWYGITAEEVRSKVKKGMNLLLELTSDNALLIKKAYPDQVTTVFIAPPAPAFETLKNRLVGRGTNTDASIAQRLENAKAELALQPQFDQVIVNEQNQLDKAIEQLKAIVRNTASGIRFAARIYKRAA